MIPNVPFKPMAMYNTSLQSARAGLVALMMFSGVAHAQEVFKARLSMVPVDTAMKKTVAGLGTASATLSGNKLSVTGSFDGLLSPATTAHIRLSRVIGVRGPELLNLTVTAATSGTLSGSFDLTPPQVESLKKGLFYIQINSEKAPDGNLWGWLQH